MKRSIAWFVICVCLLSATACFRWKSDFRSYESSVGLETVDKMFQQANDLADRADSKTKLLRAIQAYERILDLDPTHYQTLCLLSTYHLLMGDGYIGKKSEKVRHFRIALGYSERAMYTNPEFRQAVDEGAPVWEAVDSLTVDEMDAMMFWTTAVFYIYKEALGAIGQVINFRWIIRAKRVMDKMMALDPEWGGGGVYFIHGVYYLAIPERVGGDRALSAGYFQKAVDTGPTWLLNRFGRAKYFHFKMRHPEAFRTDLEWVAAQDADMASGPFAWNAFMINDAQRLLRQKESLF